LHRELKRLGVAGQGVGRVHRIGHLAQREAPLRLGAFVERSGAHCAAHQRRELLVSEPELLEPAERVGAVLGIVHGRPDQCSLT
jgi:hypothetical protein